MVMRFRSPLVYFSKSSDIFIRSAGKRASSYENIVLTHLCQMYFPIFINWTSPLAILGLLNSIFQFYSNFKRHFCKQTVENLISCRILRHLIWFCTAYRCPAKRTLRVYGLMAGLFLLLQLQEMYIIIHKFSIVLYTLRVHMSRNMRFPTMGYVQPAKA